MTDKKHCKDCDMPTIFHIQTWMDEIVDRILPRTPQSKRIETAADILLERSLGALGLIRIEDDFSLADIQMRSACFIEEARKRGVRFRIVRGIGGYTNHFHAETRGKIIRFSGLPTAGFIGKDETHVVDNKARTKEELKKKGFPVADGRSFWIWQKEKAVCYGLGLGSSLVVKPRCGSVARHVTTDITNDGDLRDAINVSLRYSPAFLVERFVSGNVYRATVVDQKSVACVMQKPANVVGDGVSTIRELAEKKNADKRRGEPNRTDTPLYKLVINNVTDSMLSEKGYSMDSVPADGEEVQVQKDPFLKLGGDLIEVTGDVHPDNLNLFKNIAREFDIRLVGIDLITQDISRSWEEQRSAVLELNSAPCIEMHHFPSSGTPQNVAGMLVDMFFRYYL